MQNDLAKDELTSIKERIATAKADHKNDLERLYAAHAEDYLDDQRLRRESREDYGSASGSASGASTGAGVGIASTSGQLDAVGGNRIAEWSEKRDVSPFPK